MNKRRFRFLLFISGFIIAIVGRFFDQVTELPWLLRMISPDYVNGINALDFLAQNRRHILNSHDPGFIVILERWPNLNKKSSVALIRRSPPYQDMLHQVKSDFELIGFDSNTKEIGTRWEESLARSLLIKELNNKRFWMGTVVFYIGLGLTVVSGLLEFLTKKS